MKKIKERKLQKSESSELDKQINILDGMLSRCKKIHIEVLNRKKNETDNGNHSK